MKNLNACLASLNLGLPDDVRRLKEAGYYTEAIACIDTYLAEDWTKTQNQPVQPAGPLPENPTPRGVDAMRDALLAQREILRRLPLDYTVPEAQALEMLQSLVRGFTPEEFRAILFRQKYRIIKYPASRMRLLIAAYSSLLPDFSKKKMVAIINMDGII